MFRHLYRRFAFELGVFGIFRIGVGVGRRQVNVGIQRRFSFQLYAP